MREKRALISERRLIRQNCSDFRAHLPVVQDTFEPHHRDAIDLKNTPQKGTQVHGMCFNANRNDN